jgi:hypothetical protein
VQNVRNVVEHLYRMHARDGGQTALIGMWVMDEVRLAVQKAYQVIEVYEMYEYNVTQYNPQTGRGGILWST